MQVHKNRKHIFVGHILTLRHKLAASIKDFEPWGWYISPECPPHRDLQKVVSAQYTLSTHTWEYTDVWVLFNFSEELSSSEDALFCVDFTSRLNLRVKASWKSSLKI